MKKVGLCLMIAVLCICFISTTNAQGVKTGGQADSAKDITITGGIDTLMVSRDTGVTSGICGVPKAGEFFMAPLIALNLDAEVAEKVSGYICLADRLYNGYAAPDAGATRLGCSNTNPAFTQAYVKVSEFVDQKVSFTLGLQDLKYTLRKGEGAFFLDVASNLNTLGTNAEFGGLKGCYGDMAKDNYAVEGFYGTIQETGIVNRDANIKGVNVDYKLPGENNMLKVILTSMTGMPAVIRQANIMTIGVGCDYWAMPALDVYGEVYNQSGPFKVGAVKCTQAAMAYRIGADYKIEHELKPVVGLSYWNLSGDKASSAKKNEGFMSYENVQSAMIIEDNAYGLDRNNNYNAIKVDAGITTALDINHDGKGEPVDVKLLIGMFNDNQAVAAGVSKVLGTEIDLAATLHYTESLAFTLGLDMLSGAKELKDRGLEGSAQMITFDTRLKF